MVRATNKLSAMAVKSAKAGKYFDGGGLTLVKNDAGGKWIFRYSISGKRREMGLGSYPETSLSEARKHRDKWATVLRDGTDPISERSRQAVDARATLDHQDPTFEECAKTVFEAKKAGLRGDGDRGRWFSPIRLHMIPKIGRKRMSQIHQSDIKDALSPIWGKKHVTAEKALQRTRIIFTQAKLIGIDVDPFTVDAARHMLGEVNHIATPTPATPWQEIPAVYASLKGDVASHLALRWMILTIVRSDGSRGARFDEIEGDIWTVPADRIKGKRGKVSDFRVPLCLEAMNVLARCQHMRQNDWLFPSYRTGCISDVAVAKTLKRVASVGAPHGLRTSFRTWVQDTQSANFDIAETALGHIIGNKVERSYARSDLLEQRRVLAEKWARFVTGSNAELLQFPAAN